MQFHHKSHHIMFLITSFSQPMRQLYENTATKQISRLVWRNQWETNFATFYKQAHYTRSIKYLYSRKNACIEQLNFAIQNRCDKVVIELRLLQLWTEIVVILVIWNQTCAARSFDLKSSVWFQTKLHFTQFNNHYFYIKRLWRRIDTSIQTHEVYSYSNLTLV